MVVFPTLFLDSLGNVNIILENSQRFMQINGCDCHQESIDVVLCSHRSFYIDPAGAVLGSLDIKVNV